MAGSRNISDKFESEVDVKLAFGHRSLFIFGSGLYYVLLCLDGFKELHEFWGLFSETGLPR